MPTICNLEASVPLVLSGEDLSPAIQSLYILLHLFGRPQLTEPNLGLFPDIPSESQTAAFQKSPAPTTPSCQEPPPLSMNDLPQDALKRENIEGATGIYQCLICFSGVLLQFFAIATTLGICERSFSFTQMCFKNCPPSPRHF